MPLATLLLIAAVQAAAAPADHLPIADKGTLILRLPAGWKEVGRNASPGLPPTFSFERAGPVRGALQLTVVWSARPDAAPLSEGELRQAALAGQAALKGQTVEDQLPLEPIAGADGKGFLYQATDKSSKGGPGDFPVLTHGELLLGKLVLSFTAFSDRKRDAAVQEALAAVQTATLAKIAAPAQH